jgi:SAM-dependent methyltransferase
VTEQDPATRAALGLTFERVAERYEVARPSYPAELFDDLVTLAQLRPGSRVLEIGSGTGKATLPMVERGFRVVCVEIGAQLADVARRKFAGLPVDIQVGPFETWVGDSGGFDLVYAATAWHWIDPEIRYRKAHDLLGSGGHLAYWKATHAFPAGFDPFFEEIQETYEAIGESHADEWPPTPPDEVADDRAEIEASGLFGDVAVRRYVWQHDYTVDGYLSLLDTFSRHIAMDPSKRAHLYREIRRRLAQRPSGLVTRHWAAILHVARKA